MASQSRNQKGREENGELASEPTGFKNHGFKKEGFIKGADMGCLHGLAEFLTTECRQRSAVGLKQLK